MPILKPYLATLKPSGFTRIQRKEKLVHFIKIHESIPNISKVMGVWNLFRNITSS